MQRTTLIAVFVLLLLAGVGVFTHTNTTAPETVSTPPTPEFTPTPATPTTTQAVLGTSVEGRDIKAYTFGTGDTDLLFVGGIHGGYEWNTIVLAYEMIDYFFANESAVPENITVHIIPNLNPDGLYVDTGIEGRFAVADIPDHDIHTAGHGRFNANKVDLNRNFPCRWKPTGNWRGQTVSGGTAPFSEPEAKIVRDYVAQIEPAAAAFWHSRANNVYGSECGDPVTPETLALMNTYAQAANYGEVPVFDAYPVTGAVEDWLAGQGIPTVSVELETRTNSEYVRNHAGVLAVLELYRD